MSSRSRSAVDWFCDHHTCPAVVEDVDDRVAPDGWTLVEEGGIWPGADAHYCPEHTP